MPVFLFSETDQNEIIREACARLNFYSHDIEKCKTFLAKYTAISKVQNWERMSMSTAQGGATLDSAYYGSCFDGRYVYFSPRGSVTFLRFDTTLLFQHSSAFEKMTVSTAQGASAIAEQYFHAAFDGRYVYYVPGNSVTLIRVDVDASFTTAASWEKISLSTALVAAALNYAYLGACYDGRYVYYAPYNSDTFLRFDTTLSFTNSSAFERMNMSTAMGAATLDNGFYRNLFDGRYVYYTPAYSDTFLRFDSTLAFTNSNAWEKVSISSMQGGSIADDAYFGAAFDGRYVYYSPVSNTTKLFLRYDTTKSFTNSGSWEKINASTILGADPAADFLSDVCFDGRYVYYSPNNSDTMIRFDTTKVFTNSSSWEFISMSTAQGAAAIDNSYFGIVYGGKYVYYTPNNADLFIRVLASAKG